MRDTELNRAEKRLDDAKQAIKELLESKLPEGTEVRVPHGRNGRMYGTVRGIGVDGVTVLIESPSSGQCHHKHFHQVEVCVD